MPCEKKTLGSLVEIKTGAPMSRAKKIAEGDRVVRARVLIPAALSSSQIEDDLLAEETVSKVKEELFTKAGDVVVKASTPYDCAFVDEKHEGLLVTSFGLILRPLPGSPIDMQYLAIYLGMEQANKELQLMSKGMTIQLIKKRDLGDLLVPVPSAEEQVRLARLFEETQRCKQICRMLAEKSDVLLQSEFYRTVHSVE